VTYYEPSTHRVS